MQKNKLTLSALAVVVGTMLVIAPAPAATLTYSRGDLFIGFIASGGTGATENYLINIGQASTYRNATSPIVLSLGNVGADLTAKYSNVGESINWFGRADLKWGVFGSVGATAVNGDNAWTLYAGKSNTNVAYTRFNSFTQSPASNAINDMGLTFAAQGTGQSTANSNVATFQDVDGDKTFGAYVSGNNAFGYFTGALDNFGDGVGSLGLYRLQTGSGAGQLVGTFDITTTGAITFTPVPEPGTVALVALGLGVALFAFRRRSAQV